MPYAVGVTLDPTSAAILKNVAEDVLRALDPETCHIGDAPPHLTLAIAEDVDVLAATELVIDIAGEWPAIPVKFASLGMFNGDTHVIFLAPVVTPDLMTIHRDFHHRFASMTKEQSPLYLPGHWVPHCTIASGLPSNLLPRAIAPCLDIALPLDARLTHIALATFQTEGVGSGQPNAELVVAPLEGSHDSSISTH